MTQFDAGDELARKVFRLTMAGAAIFVGVVFSWILF